VRVGGEARQRERATSQLTLAMFFLVYDRARCELA
jgi:hypothetical protein